MMDVNLIIGVVILVGCPLFLIGYVIGAFVGNAEKDYGDNWWV